MDIWGDDPWADNAVPAAAPRKGETGAAAVLKPNVLSSYEDEAGWGDFEGSAEDVWGGAAWAETQDEVEDGSEEEVVDVRERAAAAAEEEVDSGDHSREDESEVLADSTASTLQHEDSEEDISTSALAEANHATQRQSPLVQDSISDDEHSESEDEDAVLEETNQAVHEHKFTNSKSTEEQPSSHTRPMSSSSEATISTRTGSACSDRISLEQGLPDELTQHEVDFKTSQESSEVNEHAESQNTPSRASDAKEARTPSSPAFQADLDILHKLFEPQRKKGRKMGAEQAPEELIDSTPTRKMWYRLSRPQTLRAFLSGDMEDSHVRVAWPNSRIRADTLKIVSRWTAEDRIHGRTLLGGSTKAMFGWDEPQPARRNSQTTSPAVTKFPHARQQSVSMQPMVAKTSPVASFGWSTSPVSPSFPTAAKEVTASSPTVVSRENPWRRSIPSRPSSLIVSATSLNAVFAAETKIKSKKEDMPLALPVMTNARERSNVGLGIDTALAATADITVAEDEDDEWGEMVQSPPPSGASKFPPHDPTLAFESPSEEWGAWETPPPAKTMKKPTRISPISSKQVIPEGPLSPARRAAFSAARVTRSLSSQHETSIMAPQFQEAAAIDLSAKEILRSDANSFVPIPSPTTNLDTTSISMSPTSETAAPFSSVVTTSVDDFSLFESTYGQSEAPAPPIKARATSLSAEEARKVQSFLTHLPDLSYMFRR